MKESGEASENGLRISDTQIRLTGTVSQKFFALRTVSEYANEAPLRVVLVAQDEANVHAYYGHIVLENNLLDLSSAKHEVFRGTLTSTEVVVIVPFFSRGSE